MRALVAISVALGAALITGCSGGGGGTLVPLPTASSPSPSSLSSATCAQGARCIVIAVPQGSPVRTASVARPEFISRFSTTAKIYIATQTGAHAGGFTGSPLAGYPVTATLTRTSPGCAVDPASGYLQCSVPLPGLPADGANLVQHVELLDVNGKLVGDSVAGSNVSTLDASLNPTSYGALVFNGSAASPGTKNIAAITANGVVASVSISQGAPLAEGIAASVPLNLTAFDADGDVIAAPGIYVDDTGRALQLTVGNPGTFANGAASYLSVATSGACGSAGVLEPGCLVTLTYDGSAATMPDPRFVSSGFYRSLDTPAYEIALASQGFGAFAGFFPVVFPASSLDASTSLAFASASSPSQTVPTGFPAKFGGGYGASGAATGWEMDTNSNPVPCTGVATITNAFASFTVAPNSAGGCVSTGYFAERPIGGYSSVGEREAESYPISVAGAAVVGSSTSITPASFAFAASAVAPRTITISHVGNATNAYALTTRYCISRAATFPYSSASSVFSSSVIAASNATNPANVAVFVPPSTATLSGVSAAQVKVVPGGTGGVCQYDVAIDGSKPLGSSYFVGASW